MALSPVSPLPAAPSRTDSPADFNSKADAFMAAWPTMITQFNQVLTEIPTAVNGIDYNGTSTTSVAIATGSKSFTTQTGKNFQVGQAVRVAYTTTPANYMDGQITSYDSGTGALVVNVTAVGGSGTWAVWTISLAVSGGGSSNVTLAGTETLTNKTLTTPVLSGTASGVTAGRLGYAAGALTYGDGTSQLTVATTAYVTGLSLGGSTYSKATANQTTTSATAVDITNLAFTPAASTTYEFEAVMIVKAASSVVFKVGIAWPTGLTTGHALIVQTSSMTLDNASFATNSTGGVEVTSAATYLSGTINLGTDTYRMIRVTGLVDAGATPSGDFKLQFASNGTITATIKAGSFLKYKAVA